MGYIFFLFGPMHGKVLDAESFVEIGDGLRDSIDNVRYLIADDEFYILDRRGFTLAANWSPMNSPSFILIGPSRN